MAAPATAEDARPNAGGLNHPDDPQNLLGHIRQRSTQRDSLFPASPLGWLHDSATQAKQDLYYEDNLPVAETSAGAAGKYTNVSLTIFSLYAAKEW
jgi:hypothetical protein